VITRVGDQRVQNVSELLTKVAALKPGKAVNFAVRRQDRTLDVSITPGMRPKPRRTQQ
jgi:serine protease DegQ